MPTKLAQIIAILYTLKEITYFVVVHSFSEECNQCFILRAECFILRAECSTPKNREKNENLSLTLTSIPPPPKV